MKIAAPNALPYGGASTPALRHDRKGVRSFGVLAAL
jgi:hypothetical protein